MSNLFRKALENVPQDTRVWVAKSFDITEQILDILKEKGMTQKDLAERLGKKESEISKWMKGTHNFTEETIAKIEIALEQPITLTMKKAKEKYAEIEEGLKEKAKILEAWEENLNGRESKLQIEMLQEHSGVLSNSNLSWFMTACEQNKRMPYRSFVNCINNRRVLYPYDISGEYLRAGSMAITTLVKQVTDATRMKKVFATRIFDMDDLTAYAVSRGDKHHPNPIQKKRSFNSWESAIDFNIEIN